MFDEFERDIRLEDEQIRQNEEMLKDYNNRAYESSNISFDDMQYYDSYYGDIRDDPMGGY